MKRWTRTLVTAVLCGVLFARGTPSPAVTASPLTAVRPVASSPAPTRSSGASPLAAPMEVATGESSFRDELAADTWAYLSSDWATTNHLPWSWRWTRDDRGDYANTTEIGLYALSWLAAYELQRPWSPSWAEAETEVTAVLDQLRVWQTGLQSHQPHGPNAYQNSVFYQWYWISEEPPVVGVGHADQVVPSVDNAWLAASLITIREFAEAHGYSGMAQKADEILDDLDLRLWYDDDTHRFFWGDTHDPRAGGQPDFYSDENRIINVVARALGHLSAEEFRLSLEALKQSPGTYEGITVEKVAGDGSYFTYAAPALFLREMATSYGDDTVLPAIQAQIAYAEDQGYGAWGLSDCFDVEDGGYVQQGAPPAAIGGSPETRPGLVTPHASALAVITPLAPDAIANLRTISDTFSCAYDAQYGFRDSVMTRSEVPDYGGCSDRFSALGQEWLFLSLVNHEIGFIWDTFYRDEGVRTAHQEMFGQHRIYLPTVLLCTTSTALAPGDNPAGTRLSARD